MPDRVYENASVLFMDIVSYSKQTLDQQAKLISLLQAAVNQSTELQRTNETDLIKLPTGDGMALVFTRDLVAQYNAPWKSPKRFKQPTNSKSAWESTPAQSPDKSTSTEN